MISSRTARIVTTGLVLAMLVVPFAFSQEGGTASPADWGIVIKKKDISYKAKFYPYVVNGKAPSSSARTAGTASGWIRSKK